MIKFLTVSNIYDVNNYCLLIWGSNFILKPRETLHILNSKGIKSIFSQARNIHDHLGLMKRSKSSLLALFALLSSRKRLFFPFLIGGIKMWLKLGCKVHTENEKGAYKKELLIETYLTLAILSISYKKGTKFYRIRKRNFWGKKLKKLEWIDEN